MANTLDGPTILFLGPIGPSPVLVVHKPLLVSLFSIFSSITIVVTPANDWVVVMRCVGRLFM